MQAEAVESDMARHIARVAARLFAARGYDATSVREIVEAAGATKPTLYYHFGSKEGLAQAVLTRPMTQFVARLRENLEEPDPVEGLVRNIETHVEFMRDDPDRGRFFYALLFGPHDSSLSNELAGFVLELHQIFERVVARLVAAGRLDPARSDRFGVVCRGAVNLLTMDFLYKPCAAAKPGVADPLIDAKDVARTLVADLLVGFERREPLPGLHA